MKAGLLWFVIFPCEQDGCRNGSYMYIYFNSSHLHLQTVTVIGSKNTWWHLINRTTRCVQHFENLDERWGKSSWSAQSGYIWHLRECYVFQRSVIEMTKPVPSRLWCYGSGCFFPHLLGQCSFWRSPPPMEYLKCIKTNSADLFFCGKVEWRLGTGIRSTHKPQRHVLPTDTHTQPGRSCLCRKLLFHSFLLSFPISCDHVCACVDPGLDSEKIFI